MYKIETLLKYPKFVHGISTMAEGNMSFRFGNKLQVTSNREQLLRKLGIDMKDCVCMYVVHGNEVVAVGGSDKGKGMRSPDTAFRVDGLVTNERGVYLVLLIADCLPIILHDPKKSAVGVIHAGWKSTDLLIAKKAVEKMVGEYGCKVEDIVAGFGPAALKDSFIKESPDQVGKPEWKPFVEQVDDKNWKVDFVGYCKKQLIDAGVSEENIFESGVDTVKDGRFFSHYRDSKKPEEEQGRFACVVGLK